MGFTAVTTSSLIKILQVTQTSWIFSIGRNDAGPSESQHQISMGFEYVFLVPYNGKLPRQKTFANFTFC